jgi:hypothetical protein
MLIHFTGVLLFLFIPLVLILFLRYPFGVFLSFFIAIALMIAHRLIARPFFLKKVRSRCFWCGKTSKHRTSMEVNSIKLEVCDRGCIYRTRKFLTFANRYKLSIRIGIFVPLLWYIVTMVLNEIGIFSFPMEWNHFIFQFFIAITVVTISFAYRFAPESQQSRFPFPLHNLFLLGARNTLLVFRYIGIWWLATNLYFLYVRLSR